MLFIPQKPYLPFGTLRHALILSGGRCAGDDVLIPLMKQCRLEKHVSQLDTEGDWMNVLSLGEQQKAAFVRRHCSVETPLAVSGPSQLRYG